MANQTRVGAPKTAGGLFVGPIGSALPTDATTPLDPALLLTGLVSDDGLKETQDRKTDDKRAWGGDIARTVQSEFGVKVKVTFIERTDNVLKLAYGADNVEITTAPDGSTLRTIVQNSATLPAQSFVADMKDGDVSLRKVYPNAQVTDVGDINYVHSDLISYELELTCYKDESGNNSYEYESTPAGHVNAPIVTNP